MRTKQDYDYRRDAEGRRTEARDSITLVIYEYANRAIESYGTGADFSPGRRTAKAWYRAGLSPGMEGGWQQHYRQSCEPLQFRRYPSGGVREPDAGGPKPQRIERGHRASRPKASCARLTRTFWFA